MEYAQMENLKKHAPLLGNSNHPKHLGATLDNI
jgi:hypothetical protein